MRRRSSAAVIDTNRRTGRGQVAKAGDGVADDRNRRRARRRVVSSKQAPGRCRDAQRLEPRRGDDFAVPTLKTGWSGCWVLVLSAGCWCRVSGAWAGCWVLRAGCWVLVPNARCRAGCGAGCLRNLDRDAGERHRRDRFERRRRGFEFRDSGVTSEGVGDRRAPSSSSPKRLRVDRNARAASAARGSHRPR